MGEVEISCVVPAYQSVYFLARALTSILTQEEVSPEIIVVDDSQDGDVRGFVERIARLFDNITYSSGPRSGNPVDNWNAGLDMAHGEYSVLIHHDEFLNDPRYLRGALDQMRDRGAQVFIGGHQRAGAVTPSRFRLAVRLAAALGYAPWTLYVMNWIGPTAAFIFPTRSHARFDRRFRWIVDVDFYYRMLVRSPSVVRNNTPYVISLQHPGQITNQIDRRLLHLHELDLLRTDAQRAILDWQLRAAILTAAMRLPPWRWFERRSGS